MSEMITWDEIPEHDKAADYANQLPAVGTIIGDKKVIGARVISAFWLTENVIMKGKTIPETILSKPSARVGTVLIAVNTEPCEPQPNP